MAAHCGTQPSCGANASSATVRCALSASTASSRLLPASASPWRKQSEIRCSSAPETATWPQGATTTAKGGGSGGVHGSDAVNFSKRAAAAAVAA